MNELELYQVQSGDDRSIVAAKSPEQAAQIFVTWEAAESREPGSFSVGVLSVESFSPEHQLQLRRVLMSEKAGIVRFDAEHGWIVHWEGWISDNPADEDDRSILRIFQIGEETPADGYVLASDEVPARELLRMHFHEPRRPSDKLPLTEVALQDVEVEAANDAINEALDIGWEGLVTRDEVGLWSFTMPLGRRQDWSGTSS